MVRLDANQNKQLIEEYKPLDGAEKHSTRTLQSMHKNFAKHIQILIAKSTKQNKGYQRLKINSMKYNETARLGKKE